MTSMDDNVRAEYQASVSLWGTLVNTSWSRFNAMVVANSVIITAMGVFLTDGDTEAQPYIFIMFLSIIGLLLTVFWESMMLRDEEFQHFYSVSARHLERSINQNGEGTILRGAQLAKGCTVSWVDMPVDCTRNNEKNWLKEEAFRIRGLGKWKVRKSIIGTIWLFRITYLGLLLLAITLNWETTIQMLIIFGRWKFYLIIGVIILICSFVSFLIGRDFPNEISLSARDHILCILDNNEGKMDLGALRTRTGNRYVLLNQILAELAREDKIKIERIDSKDIISIIKK